MPTVEPVLLGVFIAVATVVGLWLAFLFFRVLWTGTVALYLAACGSLLGIVLYFAAWFFLTPLMLIASFIVGLFARDLIKTGANAARKTGRRKKRKPKGEEPVIILAGPRWRKPEPPIIVLNKD